MIARFVLSCPVALSLGLVAATALTPVARAAAAYEVLYQFPAPVTTEPSGGWTDLFVDTDGKICGGGMSNHLLQLQPTIYQLLPGGGFKNVHVIETLPDKLGYQAIGHLLPTAGGGYVGSTLSIDGQTGSTVFRLAPGTLECTVLASFPRNDDFKAEECLIPAADGTFYGCSATGGTANNGTLFRITAQGQFISLMDCPPAVAHPQRLCLDSSGVLHGISSDLGALGKDGTLFRFTAGSGITVLHTFPAAAGFPLDVVSRKAAGGFMVSTSDGLYTVTASGTATLLAGEAGPILASAPDGTVYDGSPDTPRIYRTAPDGSRLLVTGGTTGTRFLSVLADGKLYSVTSTPGIERITPATGVVEPLGDFLGTPDNVGLTGSVAPTADGSVYGLAQYGGEKFSSALFRRTAAGVTSIFATFPNGVYAVGGPLPGPDGNFYGLCMQTGTGNASIYKVTSQGQASILVTPAGLTNSYLTMGADGYLYSWTHLQGDTSYKVQQISRTGVVLQIASVPDSEGSLLSLVTATDGHIYGVVSKAGGSGTVYRFTSGELPVNVCNLTQAGYGETSAIFAGADGKLYGLAFSDLTRTTVIIFRLTPGQAPVAVHSFPVLQGGVPSYPYSLTIAADGTIYGLQKGGFASFGQAFRIGTDNSFSVLHQFEPNTGAGPYSLTLAPDGALYGVAGQTAPLEPAAGGGGTLFRLTMNNTSSPYELWLAAHHLTLADSGGDPDHDGRTNLAEFVFGTDPTVADLPVPAAQDRTILSLGPPVVQSPASSSDGRAHLIVAIRQNLEASGIGVMVRDFRGESAPVSLPITMGANNDFQVLSYPFPADGSQFLQVVIGGP